MDKKTINSLGERLKTAHISDSDRRLLELYRMSFSSAYEQVVSQISQLGMTVTGRRTKTTQSIIEKLRRSTLRLSQIQDIAGCRVVVEGTRQQNEILTKLLDTFPGTKIVDRRLKPSNHYRAVHLIVPQDSLPVEIQVRTELQHLWAQLSER